MLSDVNFSLDDKSNTLATRFQPQGMLLPQPSTPAVSPGLGPLWISRVSETYNLWNLNSKYPTQSTGICTASSLAQIPHCSHSSTLMLLIPWPPSWLSSTSPLSALICHHLLSIWFWFHIHHCKHSRANAMLVLSPSVVLAWQKPNAGWPQESVFSLPAPEQTPSNLKSMISNTKWALNIAQKSWLFFFRKLFQS